MNPFEIYTWQPSGWPEPHPCVIVSHPDRAKRKDVVEVLLCSTKRAGRQAEPHEIILDTADGLDWPTLCRCDLIYGVPREAMQSHKGQVSVARQAPLVRAIIASHGWAAVL